MIETYIIKDSLSRRKQDEYGLESISKQNVRRIWPEERGVTGG
jgi:hypothetical protein